MAEQLPGPPRILIASVGVGVPATHGILFAGAVADLAEQLGYRRVVVENDQVSAIRPSPPVVTQADRGTCPGCERRIARYPSGQFYNHACRRSA
jgi:hypothetical protein